MSGDLGRRYDQRGREASSGNDDGHRIAGIRVIDFHWVKEAPGDYFRLEALDDEEFVVTKSAHSTTLQVRTTRRGREVSEGTEPRKKHWEEPDDGHRQDNQLRNQASD